MLKFLTSAILILPGTFAPLSSSHASKWGAGHLASFPSFRPQGHTTCTAILHVSAIAKNVLHFAFNCVAGTIFLSTIIQAGSQSIENLLHEGEAREWCFHWSGLVRTLVSTSVTGKTKSRDQMLDWRPCLLLKVFLKIEEVRRCSFVYVTSN